MPAYAKLSLVTPVFHPSDIAFVLAWGKTAPGLGGWQVKLDDARKTELVSIIPPGGEAPVFFIVRHTTGVIMERTAAGAETRAEVGRYKGLRDAVLALCPLEDSVLEDVQVALELDFPRDER